MNLTDEFTFLRVWFHVGIHEVSGFQSPEGGLGANGDTIVEPPEGGLGANGDTIVEPSEGGLGANGDTIVELSEGGLGTNGKHECVERQHGMTPKGQE